MTSVPFLAATIVLALSQAMAESSPAQSRDGPSESSETPGISIQRAPPSDRLSAQLEQLRIWSPLFGKEISPVRQSSSELFAALESSSLASQQVLCRELYQATRQVDRALLLPSPEVRIDRILVGVLERYRAGAEECLVARYLLAFRLFEEARAGLSWIDHHLARRFRPPIPMPGLEGRD